MMRRDPLCRFKLSKDLPGGGDDPPAILSGNARFSAPPVSTPCLAPCARSLLRPLPGTTLEGIGSCSSLALAR